MKYCERQVERFKKSIEAAERQLSLASYIGECGANAGLRTIYEKQSEWLSDILWLAKNELRRETITKR